MPTWLLFILGVASSIPLGMLGAWIVNIPYMIKYKYRAYNQGELQGLRAQMARDVRNYNREHYYYTHFHGWYIRRLRQIDIEMQRRALEKK